MGGRRKQAAWLNRKCVTDQSWTGPISCLSCPRLVISAIDRAHESSFASWLADPGAVVCSRYPDAEALISGATYLGEKPCDPWIESHFQRRRQAWYSLTEILKQRTSSKHVYKTFGLEYRSPEMNDDSDKAPIFRGNLPWILTPSHYHRSPQRIQPLQATSRTNVLNKCLDDACCFKILVWLYKAWRRR